MMSGSRWFERKGYLGKTPAVGVCAIVVGCCFGAGCGERGVVPPPASIVAAGPMKGMEGGANGSSGMLESKGGSGVVPAGGETGGEPANGVVQASAIESEVGLRKWRKIVLHHSATERGSVESIHAEHSKRKDGSGQTWKGIGYHFVIGNGNGMPDGNVERTFRWKEQIAGAHAGVAEYNEYGIGICLIGNMEQHGPTRAQLESLNRLVAELKGEFGIDASGVVGHQAVRDTACPGKYFPLKEVAAVSAAKRNSQRESHRRDKEE